MRRRAFIAFVGAAVVWPLTAGAQQPGRVYRLGMLTGAGRASPRIAAFFDELKVLGFVEGQNLEVVVSGFDLCDDQFADVAATLTKAAPDVVFCVSDAATRAAQESAHAVPVVAMSPDLVAAGLVPSLARPGGNITGVSVFGAELSGKRQELLTEAVPEARRMAALADPAITSAAEILALKNGARARGIELAVFTAAAPDQIAPAIDKAKASGAAALNVLTAPMFSFNRRIVIERAIAQGLPAIYEWPEMAEEGGLIGYGPRLTLLYRQAARLLAKILRGAKPGDLPVEQPTTFELVVNLKTAKLLGLAIPESFLVRADKVIE
jgi:putative tryptophan/tyrosine transport system substrate-binding protein